MLDQDTDTINEFSTSEFDETSVDERSANGGSVRGVRKLDDLYPMHFKQGQVSQWNDDGTMTILRHQPTETSVDLANDSDRKYFESTPNDDPSESNPPERQFRRLSSFGKPLPILSDTSEEVEFSTDNPLYETLSQKERFEQSKQEIEKALSMKERDRQEKASSFSDGVRDSAPVNDHSTVNERSRQEKASSLGKHDIRNSKPDNTHVEMHKMENDEELDMHTKAYVVDSKQPGGKSVVNERNRQEQPDTYTDDVLSVNVTVGKREPDVTEREEKPEIQTEAHINSRTIGVQDAVNERQRQENSDTQTVPFVKSSKQSSSKDQLKVTAKPRVLSNSESHNTKTESLFFEQKADSNSERHNTETESLSRDYRQRFEQSKQQIQLALNTNERDRQEKEDTIKPKYDNQLGFNDNTLPNINKTTKQQEMERHESKEISNMKERNIQSNEESRQAPEVIYIPLKTNLSTVDNGQTTVKEKCCAFICTKRSSSQTTITEQRSH